MVKSKRKRIRMTGTMKKQQLLRWVAGRPNSPFLYITIHFLYSAIHFSMVYQYISIFYYTFFSVYTLFYYLFFTILPSILLINSYSYLYANLHSYLYLPLLQYLYAPIFLLIDLYKNIWYNKRKMIGDFICLIMI